jgi:hypothetical protein
VAVAVVIFLGPDTLTSAAVSPRLGHVCRRFLTPAVEDNLEESTDALVVGGEMVVEAVPAQQKASTCPLT